MGMIQPFGTQKSFAIPTSDIRIRDPFIVPDADTRIYYMFGTTDSDPWNGPGEGFLVYASRDLNNWTEPTYAFRPPVGFWADKQFWAPEVHFYKGSWYMLASFKSDTRCRGTQILRSEHLTGPYLPISDGPVTPGEWECLDGTLFVETDGTPWLVFSHEWTQIQNGAICAAPLAEDLTSLATSPITLFHAKDASWCVPNTGDVVQKEGNNFVTDGPFLYRTEGGKLQMIWSSFSRNGYAIGIAESVSGNVIGPWKQQDAPAIDIGGHGMLFRDFFGDVQLAIHSPNTNGKERLKIVPFGKCGDAFL